MNRSTNPTSVASIAPTEFTEFQDLVYALAKSDSAIYAARASGLYRSADGGQSWQKTNPFSDDSSLYDSQDPIAVLAVIAQGQAVFAGVNGGVLCSADDGEHWQFVPLASPLPQVVALAISPTYVEDGFVAAGTAEDGVFFSTDHGQHWAAWNFGLLDRAVYALAISPRFAADRTLYAGTETGLVRSKNGGKGWQEVAVPSEAAPILSVALSPTFESDGTIYIGSENHGLYVSYDSGRRWEPGAGQGDTADTAVNMICLTNPPRAQIWLLRDDKLVVADTDSATWRRYPIDGTDAESVTAVLVSDHQVMIGFLDGTVQVSAR